MGEDSKAQPPVQRQGSQVFVAGDEIRGLGVPPAPPQARPALPLRPMLVTEGALPPPPPPQAAQPAAPQGGANTPQPAAPSPSSAGASTGQTSANQQK